MGKHWPIVFFWRFFFVHSLECKIQLIVPVQNLPDQNRSTVFNKFRNKKGNRPHRKVRPPVKQTIMRHQHLPSFSIIFAPFFLVAEPTCQKQQSSRQISWKFVKYTEYAPLTIFWVFFWVTCPKFTWPEQIHSFPQVQRQKKEPHLALQGFPFFLFFFWVAWTQFAWPEQIHSFQQVQK